MAKWNFAKKQVFCQKRVIVIATEGMVTEPQYFQKLNSMSTDTTFYVVENYGNASSPKAVLKRMKKYLRENPLGKDDEAWIVIDRDQWSDAELEEVAQWASRHPQHHYALSERRFENWLALHVENDNAAQKKYKDFLSGKVKHVPYDFLTKDRVLAASAKAKQLYPTKKSVGNMFELIEHFFKSCKK